MLAYTGLETVANLAEETREPGKTLPRSLFSLHRPSWWIMTVLIAIVGTVCAFPAEDGSTDLGRRMAAGADRRDRDGVRRAPCLAVVDGAALLVGLSGALVLFAAATTAITGCTRLAALDGGARMLPREFGRLQRRSLVSREALVATGALATAVVGRDRDLRRATTRAFLASAYSFGVLFAFTAAQLAVIRLRRPSRTSRVPSGRGRR